MQISKRGEIWPTAKFLMSPDKPYLVTNFISASIFDTGRISTLCKVNEGLKAIYAFWKGGSHFITRALSLYSSRENSFVNRRRHLVRWMHIIFSENKFFHCYISVRIVERWELPIFTPWNSRTIYHGQFLVLLHAA